MTDLIKIPANSEAYLTAVRDDAADKFDIVGFEYDFLNSQAWDLPDQVIEMLGSGVGYGYDTVDAPLEEAWVWFDPSKYDGTCQFFFEITGWNYDFDWNSGENELDVKLVDGDDTEYASVTMAVNRDDVETYYWYDYYWYRSASFTPPAEACWLTVKIPSGIYWGDEAIELQSARILVRQTGATKTRTMIPLLHGWGIGFDDPEESYWQYNAAEIGTIKTCWFEVNGQGPGDVRLYDITAAAAVSGTTISLTSSQECARVEFSPDLLTDGHVYKFDGSSGWAYAAWLSLELDPCTKFATWYRIGMQCSDEYWDGGRDEAESWSGYNLFVNNYCRQHLRLPSNAKAYLEATAAIGPAGSGSGVGVRSDGSNTHDWYGTTLSAHALSFTGSKELKRSAEITDHLTDGIKYVTWWGGVYPAVGGNYAYVLPCGVFIVLTAEP